VLKKADGQAPQTRENRRAATVAVSVFGKAAILRAGARQALAGQGGGGVTAALLGELGRDESPRARALLALFLGERGDAAAGPALLTSLGDPAPMVRGAAAEALVRIYRVCHGFDAEEWKSTVARGPLPEVPDPAPARPHDPSDPGPVTTAAPRKRLEVADLVGQLVPTFYGIPLDQKTVVVVFDFSSSVRRFGDGPAKQALEEALSLLPSDRFFNVLAFDERILAFSSRPLPARPTPKERIGPFLDELPKGQRTELLLPIRTGLVMAGKHAAGGAQLLIISDGAPTVSSSTLDDIIERVEALRGKRVRVDAAVYGGREVGLFRYLVHRTGGRTVAIDR